MQLFFAGVKQQGNDLVTSGGRVLTVMATAPSFEIAIARAYEAASKIKFDGCNTTRHRRKALMQYRGHREESDLTTTLSSLVP